MISDNEYDAVLELVVLDEKDTRATQTVNVECGVD